MPSAYYNPEEHDPPLEIVASFDAYEPDYSFDILLVVREKATGKLFVSADSGCSCPVPFEDHRWPDDFQEIKSWQECKRLLDKAFPLGGYRHRKPHDSLRRAVQNACRPDAQAALNLIAKEKEALSG